MKRILRAPVVEELDQKQREGKFSWRFDWDDLCKRCFGGLFFNGRCRNCGMKEGRVVKRHRRRKIGGKYGRNSGKVQTSK